MLANATLNLQALKERLRTPETWLAAFVFALLVTLFLVHLYVIHHHAVNLPYLDDFALFRDGHPARLSLSWLFDAANMRNIRDEHVISTTKLFVWMQYQLNGWNISVHFILDFLIYGLFVWWIGGLAHQVLPTIPRWTGWAFAIFLLSPINWFNHFMATQSSFRFYLIFFCWSTHLLFKEEQRWPHMLAGSILSILSIYSLASGFGSCLFLFVAFAIFKGGRLYSTVDVSRRVRERKQLLVVVCLIGGALLSWISSYVSPPQYSLVFPNDLRFWIFVVNLVSFGFGIEQLSATWGIVCLLIVLIPICASAWRRQLTTTHWGAVVMVGGILLNVAEIAMGRAGRGAFFQPKAVRYVEFVLPLIPLSMINWAVFLQHRKRLRAFALAGLFLFGVFTFSNNWSFDVYREAALSRIEGRQCVKVYYEGVGDGRCPAVYPVDTHHIPLSTWLEGARREKASFYNEIEAELTKEKKTTDHR